MRSLGRPVGGSTCRSILKVGASAEVEFVVAGEHTIGFADQQMPAVLSTPQLIGFLEQAALTAVQEVLDPDERTVGVQVDIQHLAATPMGARVTCRARVIHVQGRQATFQVEARDEHERIARGVHRRVVIRVDRFADQVRRKVLDDYRSD